MKTKILSLLLILTLLTSLLVACGAQSTPDPNAKVNFTDSVGRTVEIPANISRIAVTGTMAQLVVFAIAPDLLVGTATKWDPSSDQYIDDKYLNLPVLGQLYGGKGDWNLEELLAAAPQVIIDVGEAKDGIAADLDALQQQTGLPFVHISATTETMPEVYQQLGLLLGRPNDAEALANYCSEIYDQTITIINQVGTAGKSRLLYCLGDQGHNVIARDSYHSEVIDLLADNLAVVESPSAKGLGNEVDMEQILLWNPDVILFAPGSVFADVASDESWQKVAAVASGRYYEVPYGPDNWLGFPPSVQRYLGMLWMTKLLYPANATYDLHAEVARFYQLFYHSELTAEQYSSMTANALE